MQWEKIDMKNIARLIQYIHRNERNDGGFGFDCLVWIHHCSTAAHTKQNDDNDDVRD